MPPSHYVNADLKSHNPCARRRTGLPTGAASTDDHDRRSDGQNAPSADAAISLRMAAFELKFKAIIAIMYLLFSFFLFFVQLQHFLLTRGLVSTNN